MQRLQDRVAVISRAASMQGTSQARLFASEGARVIVADPDEAAARLISDEIAESGGIAVSALLDVGDELHWAAVTKLAIERYGRLDILVNNASADTKTALADTKLDEWDAAVNSGARGSFFGARAALRVMLEQHNGVIVNVTSIAAMTPPNGTSEAHASVSGALRILTKDISADYAGDGIRCNTVHAGLIDGELLGTGSPLSDDAIGSMLAITPMRRQGSHDEVAKGVLFLASDDASFITGTELIIDGGYVGF